MTQSNDWIKWKWTPEKPYPESERYTVEVKYDDCEVFKAPVERFYWDCGDITNYRLA